MSEQITTAAELDALPVGSVVLDRAGFAWAKRGSQGGRWFVASHAGPGVEIGTDADGPFRVLFRPDAPVTAGATVTREQVDAARTVIERHERAVRAASAIGDLDYAVPIRAFCEQMRTALGLTVVDGPTEGGGERG